MKANAQAAEAAKAKAKALAEKNKLLQVKAVEQKKKLALEAKMKAEKAKALALKVNKTVGGSSKFKNSFTPAPAKAACSSLRGSRKQLVSIRANSNAEMHSNWLLATT